MLFLFTICIIAILIIYVCIQKNQIEKLKAEIRMLMNSKECVKCKARISKWAVFCKNCGSKQVEVQTSEENNYNVETKQAPVAAISYEETKKQREKQIEEEKEFIRKREKTSRENKNTAILCTGAGLVILAAIIFLTSAWNVVSDGFKTIALLLFVGIFMQASKIAKEKFGLEKASKTFFYIAMAYIPICVLSISILGLFGEFLSIHGDGRYIYLSISSLLISGIYYLMHKTKTNYVLYGASLVFQILAVSFGVCILTAKLISVAVGVLLYNMVLLVLSDKKDMIIFSTRKTVSEILAYTVGTVAVFNMLNTSMLMSIILILLTINFLIISLVDKNKVSITAFNVFLNFVGIHIVLNPAYGIKDEYKTLLILLNTVGLYIAQYAIFAKFPKNIFKRIYPIISYLILLVMFGVNIIQNGFMQETVLKTYVIAIMQVILLMTTYSKTTKVYKELINILLPFTVIVSGITACMEYALSYHAYMVFAIGVFIVGELLINKNMRKSFFIQSHILLFASTLIIFVNQYVLFKDDFIYLIALVAIYAYSWLKTKMQIHKYVGYILFNISISALMYCIGLAEYMIYITPMITLLAIMYLERVKAELEDNFSSTFITFYQIVAYIMLFGFDDEPRVVLAIIFTIIVIYQNRLMKKSELNDTVPILGNLFIISQMWNLDVMRAGLIVVATTVITAASLAKRKLNPYTVFSAMYLACTVYILDTDYLNQLLVITWAIVNSMCMREDRAKDIFKVIASIAMLNLYLLVADAINLVEYASFVLLGYISLAAYIIRSVIKKHITNVDSIEISVFSIIYFIGMFVVKGTTDSLLALMLLIGIIIFSYIKRYGALFCITIGALIVNTLYMVKKFIGTSIPWWVYLLGFGVFLIAFAVKNELNENKNSKSLFETIKDLKDKIDD